MLESGRLDLLSAVDGISPQQAVTGPSPDRWSTLEFVEHVILLEDRYLDWIEKAPAILQRRDPAREFRLYTAIQNRVARVGEPKVLRPRGRFHTLDSAGAELNVVRS